MPVARAASCRVANAFLTRLKLILPKFSQKTAKMSKNAFFCKKLQESMGEIYSKIENGVGFT